MLKKIFILGMTLALAGCNLPNKPLPTPTTDAVGTQVSQLLTQVPTATTAAQELPSATVLPSATTAPATATVAPTQAPTEAKPTATTPSGDPKTSLGTPTWRDTLETGKSFYLYDNDNTKVTLDNGALALTGVSANGWMGWTLTFSHPAQNFYIEGTFQPQTCSGADMYGLVFRAPSDSAGYYYGVTCDGKFDLHARDFNSGADTTLVELTSSSAILAGAGQTNRLGVMANGDKISLYANGTLVKELNDSTYIENKGYFGALVAANVTTGFTARLDEISLWKLP